MPNPINPVSQKIQQLSEHLDVAEHRLGLRVGDGNQDQYVQAERLGSVVLNIAEAMHHLQMLKNGGGHE